MKTNSTLVHCGTMFGKVKQGILYYFTKNKWFIYFALLLSSFSQNTFSQVPIPDTTATGWSSLATLKWDNRNYLVTTGNYSGYVTPVMSATQAFAIGTNRLTIVMGTGITTTGQDTLITGYTNSYGTPSAILTNGGKTLNSVDYSGNGTITLTFDTVASHMAFSLYAIDQNQTATVTATDGSGNALNIRMANAAASGAINTITGSGTTSSKATASGGTSNNNSNAGTVNVYILGLNSPAGTNGVKTITITIGGTAGGFWLSDIWACIYRGFTPNYYKVSKPLTNQPAYTLAADFSTPVAAAIALTPGTGLTIGGAPLTAGNARFVFKDSSATLKNTRSNSYGYDPYNHILYYIRDNTTSPPANKAVRKYSFNYLSPPNATMSSGLNSTVIPDITAAPFNIPVFIQGIESGGGAFSNGSYYIGIEGSGGLGLYTMVWRIDFNTGDSVPYQACQAFAVLADNISTTLHNYGDLSISNDTLYDFNSGIGSYSGFIHYDLTTGLVVHNYLNNVLPGAQSAVAWNQQVYGLATLTDSIAKYDYNGQLNNEIHIFGNSTVDWQTGVGALDASDAFLPPLDYGDAPASYDTTGGTQYAGHDYDSTITLGTYWNPEFAPKWSATASADNSDDGVITPPIFSHTQTNYSVTVSVYNHSGSNVTLAGWIDLNNDGAFSSSEGTMTIVGSSPGLQSVTLNWNGFPMISNPLITQVFMRIRVTSASNGMTTSNATGYFSNGEVEDYQLLVLDNVLPVNLVNFNAYKQGGSVLLNWTTASKPGLDHFIVERSTDNGTDWEQLGEVMASEDNNEQQNYTYTDASPAKGTNLYRLQITGVSGSIIYSNIKQIDIQGEGTMTLIVYPNPVGTREAINIQLSGVTEGVYQVSIVSSSGQTLKEITKYITSQNSSMIPMPAKEMPAGTYIVMVKGNRQLLSSLVIIQ